MEADLVSARTLGRRGFLALGGALTTLAATPRTAEARTEPATGFAVITDTHANVDRPDRTAWLRDTFASIDRADPLFVLNCGDITEYGGDDEYATYLGVIPDRLKPIVKHVPGNHETRWDVHGLELFHKLFGPGNFTFRAGGLHVVGLDPTVLLQEPPRFGRERLARLTRDLAAAGDTPTIAFVHFPIGRDNYFFNDPADYLETLDGSPLRAIFAGHIHTQVVHRMNGFTQVACDDSAAGPVYYWVEIAGGALRVEAVSLAGGTETRTDVAEIPLDDTGDRRLRPKDISVGKASGDRLPVSVRLDDASSADVVRAQVYPAHIFGGTSAGSWVDLAPDGTQWRGSLDVSDLPAGDHEVQVRVLDKLAAWESLAAFALSGGRSDRWRVRLGGMVQGALAVRGGLVVAASTDGTVQAARPSTRGWNPLWSRRLGPVYRGAAFTSDGLVVVPSADHRVHALRARDGRTRWTYEVPEPVLSSPLVTTIGSLETVLFTAGKRLYAVTAATGERRWDADLHGFFAGRVACDGTNVYTGGGDGNAYAFDAATGAERWTLSTTDRTTAYIRLIYGPWDDTVELLPGGRVLVSTVIAATALDRSTGEPVWKVDGGFVYAPALVLDEGVVLVDERSGVRLVDPATGAARWGPVDLGGRAFNAGPVVRDGVLWLRTVGGLLAGLDLATGAVVHRQQLGPVWAYSTPVVANDVLATAGMDGVVRGLTPWT